MVALQIRDVPEKVRDSLAALAAARGQSLQAYLLTLVTEEARRSDNLAMLSRFVTRVDGSRLTLADAVEAIEQAAAERDTRLSEVMDHRQ